MSPTPQDRRALVYIRVGCKSPPLGTSVSLVAELWANHESTFVAMPSRRRIQERSSGRQL
jgi:hypothetical protein